MRKIGVRPAGGVKPHPFYYSKRWRFVRSLVLRRDRYRCVKCGIDVSGSGQARVDHIKPLKTHPHLAFDMANLRSLCPACDNQSHSEKGHGKGSQHQRIERTKGFDRNGEPLDPNHHWRAES
jgi:5-methylcytosine-specific restriction endonuclease McrA